MEEKDLDKALDLVSKLLIGEEVNKSHKENVSLYEEYVSNANVYDCVHKILKRLNLSLYEYKEGLYVTAGEKNRVFGYTNEELKKAIGIKRNKELYLCYFIIYNIITCFYHDSAGYTYTEYIKVEDIIRAVDEALQGVLRKMEILILNEVEENSFRQLALIWEDLPTAAMEDTTFRAARNSKAGYVKLVVNFMCAQKLLLETQERYYPSERLRALVEDYFEEYQGRLHEIMSTDCGETEQTKEEEKEHATDKPDSGE